MDGGPSRLWCWDAQMMLAQLVHEVIPQRGTAVVQDLRADPQHLGRGSVAQSPPAELGQNGNQLDRGFSQAVGGAAAGAWVFAGEQARVEKIAEPAGEDVGGDAFGGAGFASALIAAGVVDEVELYINPVALGHGRTLFADARGDTALRLLSAQAYECGVVVTVHAIAG